MEDIVLINKILNNDSIAEEKLYEKYKKIVFNIIKFKYGSYNDIYDDVSEILIKIFTKLNRFDPNKSKFKSWVYSITQNYLIDKWRGNNKVSFNISSSNPISEYDTNMICTDIMDFDNVNTVNYISEQLDNRDFTLLNMKYLQGYSYDEIGKEFNLTSTTVSNRVNYIKTKLKKNNIETIF